MSWLKDYEKTVRYAGIKVNAKVIIGLGALIIVAGLSMSLLLKNAAFLVISIAVADLVVMGPYFIGKRKIEEVERNLSEALRQMAAVLRSGGTFEVAVREISLSDYGQLSREFARMLREMEGGKSFPAALQSLSLRVNSDLLDKVTLIISDAIRTGGRVADILEEIADDIRAFYHTRRERRARTTMQFFFLFAAAAVLGPFLIGITMGISDFMVKLGERIAASGSVEGFTPQELMNKKAIIETVNIILTMFVIIEATLSAFLGATMREGKAVYGVMYAPIYIVIAYSMLVAGRTVVHMLTGI